MQKYHSHHPDPDGKYWTIYINQDLPQEVAKIKEITTSTALGVRRKGFILFNAGGDMIGIQTYQQPSIKDPAPSEQPKKEFGGFNLNFKMPKELGLFPPYKVLVALLKTKKNENT